ncbi:MAG: aminotransferase class V-fold PLP-dependent enzyme, partial [bacterium]
MDRREFLKKTKTGLAGVAALSTLSSIRAVFAEKLEELNLESDQKVDFANLREQYLLAPHIKYFNHGSIGTMPKMVHQAYRDYLAICETNPWLYMWSDPWEEARVKTREKVASFVGCGDDELVFTHNTTEGFNLLASGLPLKQGDEVVFTSLNHSGASVCWEHYANRHGFKVRRVDFPRNETPNLTAADVVAIYEKSLSEKTRVLVLPHIDNVVGIRHPVKEIATMAKEKGVQYVAVDGAQAIGMIPVNVGELGVDFYATSTHKWLQTPKGTGLLYMRKEVQSHVRPMWVTWGQNRWKGTVRIFEDYGTRNLAAVLTLGDAIDFKNKLGKEAAH